MIDAHVHVGQFYDMYVSPQLLSALMREVGADRYAVSSTTMCDNDYTKVLHELQELRALDGEHMLPVLWVTPQLLIDDKEQLFLDSGLPWACIKIHPGLCEDFWQTETECTDYVVRMATDLHVPILIHTGEKNHCEPHRFEHIIKRHPSQRFILAHGRPIDETIDLLQRYDNTLTDTAFMPTENIVRLIAEGLTDRMLWGTDSCIIRHFEPEVNVADEYHDRLENLRRQLPAEPLHQITHANAASLWNN